MLAWSLTGWGAGGLRVYVHRQHQCRLCGAELTRTFVDLGMSPLCESYVPEERLDEAEVFYPLHVRLCDACLLVQLPAYVSGETYLFRLRLLFFVFGFVGRACEALRGGDDRAAGADPGSLVTEVASNDGYLLQHFQAAGIPVLGVEPAANVAEAARARGIRTEVQFLGADTGREIAQRDTAGPTWWRATTSSPTCRTSRASRPGCARWSRTRAW